MKSLTMERDNDDDLQTTEALQHQQKVDYHQLCCHNKTFMEE